MKASSKNQKKIDRTADFLSDGYRSATASEMLAKSAYGQYVLKLKEAESVIPNEETFFFGWLAGKFNRHVPETNSSEIYNFESFAALAKTLREDHAWRALADDYSEADFKAHCTARMSAEAFDAWIGEGIDSKPGDEQSLPDACRMLVWIDKEPNYWVDTVYKQIPSYNRFLEVIASVKEDFPEKYNFDEQPDEQAFKYWVTKIRYDLWKKAEGIDPGQNKTDDILRWLDAAGAEEFKNYNSFCEFVRIVDQGLTLPSEDDFLAHATLETTQKEYLGWLKDNGYSIEDKEAMLSKWLIRSENDRLTSYSRMCDFAAALGIDAPAKMAYFDMRDTRAIVKDGMDAWRDLNL
ncbi:MAG: hypothetical protein PHE27_03310 [Alphaproteobacteria bacterium]|nr:hypothetical protein [Alphaproteobacteria bacterium]